ncbi:MAG: hypothetical protein H0W34_06575 [Pyrinomonadaceae bacterium]|nr:hypothetical protein [Pyrinomonadaceae bacterium]
MPLTLLDRLQRRFGWLAIPNLTLILIAGQAALYIASYLPQGISLDRVMLDPAKVMHGEVWRLATFLFTPPAARPLFVIFYFMLFHLFGSTLEQQWGVFKFNLFLFVGWIANVAAAFAGSAILGQQLGLGDNNQLLQLVSIPASNAFLYGSVFLAFSRLYPDFTLNLFFVLPIRIKWLALLTWLGYGYMLVRGDWMTRMLIIATVLNYLLFFGREHWRELRQGQRRRSFQANTTRAVASAKHTCVVCGLSNEESPRALFRYCSKCSGQRCYCPEHIRDHEHVIDKEPAG